MRPTSQVKAKNAMRGRSPTDRLARRPKVTDRIVAAVREEILSGTLPSGAQLPTEKELAKRFSVSQPTIREVLRALDYVGLVDVHHGSGTYVSQDMGYGAALALQNLLQLQQPDFIQVLDVRGILGLASASRAAKLVTPSDLRNIDAALKRLNEVTEATSLDDVTSRIIAFQEAISAASHNPLLTSLESFLIRFLLMMHGAMATQRSVKFWKKRSLTFKPYRTAVVTAIAKRDVQAATNAMIRYLEHERAVFINDGAVRSSKVTDPVAFTVTAEIVSKKRNGTVASS